MAVRDNEIYKKLSCRRETARLHVAEYFAKSLKTTQGHLK